MDLTHLIGSQMLISVLQVRRLHAPTQDLSEISFTVDFIEPLFAAHLFGWLVAAKYCLLHSSWIKRHSLLSQLQA